ncbi:hypothetical protein SADO_14684 [Salinisphaera dokdonensis CL-ES53]|uniref:Uncharacterized protein n=1 Tax=Salinisphaera dokdonensis CL-ES53 TaxID=1304272 RepID=A0ABV2B3P3_9GAMM
MSYAGTTQVTDDRVGRAARSFPLIDMKCYIVVFNETVATAVDRRGIYQATGEKCRHPHHQTTNEHSDTAPNVGPYVSGADDASVEMARTTSLVTP